MLTCVDTIHTRSRASLIQMCRIAELHSVAIEEAHETVDIDGALEDDCVTVRTDMQNLQNVYVVEFSLQRELHQKKK